MWISRHEWEKAMYEIRDLKQDLESARHNLQQAIQREVVLTSRVQTQEAIIDVLKKHVRQAHERIHWLVAHFSIAADSLIFVYEIDGVTFKSKHMSLTLPAGKQVKLTIKGSGVDAQNNRVEAPITEVTLGVSGTGLAVVNNPDGTFTLKYVSDETIGTLTANAKNSLGSAVSGTDSYTTGGTPPPPVVADSLTFNYGPIEDIPA